ncbi:hypothetical protein V8C86DRAFT_232476 [Haematococcus lacustris]
MKDVADQERQLAESIAQMQQAEAVKQRELQRIENDKRRVVAESASKREVVQGKAQAQLLSATTALKWREAVAAAGRDGAAGLEALRQLLQQAAQEQQEGSQHAVDTLDTVFGSSSGLGARLLQYAAAPPAAEDQLDMSAPAAHKQLKRGLALMGEAKWIQALEFFEAQAANTPSNAEPTAPLPSPQPNPNSSPDTVLRGGSSKYSKRSDIMAACITLCKAKLGLTLPPAPRSLVRLPDMASSGGKPDSAWPDPLQHLSKAVSAAAQAKSGQGGRQQPGQSAAVVVGEALACLLHPGTPAWLPAPLQQLAQGLLSEQAATFAATGPMLSGPAPAAGQPGEVPAGWLKQAKTSQALSKLLQLTGLEPVKREMFNLADHVELEKSGKRDLNSRQYNICFYGNPGTGKTTVAPIYAALLTELGVLPDAQEADAARKRYVSDQEAARLRGKASALQQQLQALEDDLRRRKELMAAEMEAKELELTLELQKAQAPAQLAAWAAEQEHQAVMDQAAQEERAAAERLRLEANKLAAEEATQQAKLMKEMADQERQLAEISAQLLQAEAVKQRELQRIENDKRRVVAESASKREVVQGKAQAQLLSDSCVDHMPIVD